MELCERAAFLRKNDLLKGDDIKLLQAELRRLRYEIPDNESGTFSD